MKKYSKTCFRQKLLYFYYITTFFYCQSSIHITRHKLYRGKGPVLTVKEIAVTSKPEQEVATFY